MYLFKSWTGGNLELHGFIINGGFVFWEISMDNETCSCWAVSSLKDFFSENPAAFRNLEIYFADKNIPLLNNMHSQLELYETFMGSTPAVT